MSLSKVSHLPVAALLAALITLGMPAIARLHPKPAEDPWLKIRPQLHPVAGTLTCNGRPVANACVTFVAQLQEEGREYMAVSSTDKNGRFWLRTFSSHGDGAVAGTHFIRVEKMVPTGRVVACSGIESSLDLGAMTFWSSVDSPSAGEGDPSPMHGMAGPMGDLMMDPMMGFCGFPGMPEMVNVLPSRFTDEKNSGLIAEVSADTVNEFLIEILTEPPVAEPSVVDHEAPARRAEEASPRESTT